MEDVDGELVVVASVGDLGSGGDDRVGLLRRQQPEVLVHLRASAFQQTQSADLGALQAPPGDREVLHGTLSLRTPQCVCRHPDFAHGVVFDAVFGVVLGGVSGHKLGSFCGGYGNGYAALLSPVKSIAEYSLSLDSRW